MALFRKTILLSLAATVLLVTVGGAYALEPPQFEVVPQHLANRGAGPFETVKEGAAEESFFNRMFGTDCWSRALHVVEHSCRGLSSEQQARLAVSLFNCHMRQSGMPTVTCTANMSIRDCTRGMGEAGFIVYSNFVQHVDSMCLFILNQEFDRHTEHLINTLHSATDNAASSLKAVSAELSHQSAALQDVGDSLQAVATSQESLHNSINEAADSMQRLEDHGRQMGDALSRSLEQGSTLLLQQEEVKSSLGDLESQQVRAAEAALRQWSAAEQRATALAERQAKLMEVQVAIAKEAAQLSRHTAGLTSAMELVLDYERRSDQLLLLMLGRSYTLEDAVLFYAAALAAALAATALPSTRGTRMPVLMLLGLTVAAERMAPSSNSVLLQVDESGTVLLQIPTAAGLLAAATTGDLTGLWPVAGNAGGSSFVSLDYKWLVRRMWICACMAMLLHKLLTYRDYQHESYRLLRTIEERMQTSEQLMLQAVARMERRLAAETSHLAACLAAATGQHSTGWGQPVEMGKPLTGDSSRMPASPELPCLTAGHREAVWQRAHSAPQHPLQAQPETMQTECRNPTTEPAAGMLNAGDAAGCADEEEEEVLEQAMSALPLPTPPVVLTSPTDGRTAMPTPSGAAAGIAASDSGRKLPGPPGRERLRMGVSEGLQGDEATPIKRQACPGGQQAHTTVSAVPAHQTSGLQGSGVRNVRRRSQDDLGGTGQQQPAVAFQTPENSPPAAKRRAMATSEEEQQHTGARCISSGRRKRPAGKEAESTEDIKHLRTTDKY
eukprot:CAMPEP_0117676580 /NCGR_PEP_ID=MMETSP0804-20121206/16251_1 /TAXON_ID=1074897 /ORGANISM="Tetraselmis astigmatica, Strain CCMP880" /LENGTH=781 /DNA_ID=CAMNT_0005485733 /DNA_START=299 /DNA_END=2644 /DNA_ORIENTATION=-